MRQSHLFTFLASFLHILAILCNLQQPLGNVWSPQGRISNDGLFTPLEDLSLLSSERHTTLAHPLFPNHSVRIKKSHDFCDPTVNSYTGYIDVEARHLFFYFFESRNDPSKDDVILWTNGGPGCSSAVGLFMELGPCSLKDENTTVINPHSWNSNANIFFIEQPVGVGFSYAEYGEYVGTTEEAARDISNFVAIFFEHFNQFQDRGFHLAGESYSGRYLPIYAAEIYDQNTRFLEVGLTPINLQSVMIGNGLTDFFTQIYSGYDFGCSVYPFLSIDQCVKLKQLIPRCKRWTQSSCIDTFDMVDCRFSSTYCNEELWAFVYDDLGWNPYDIRRKCEGDIEETLCYPEVSPKLTAYLNHPSTRQKLGVDPRFIGKNYTTCSADVGSQFVLTLDYARPTYHYVGALLERGVRVLTYVGNYDWLCNWVGVEAWTLALEWSGKDAFGREELREWEVDGKIAGFVRSFGGFTFATIDGAGHMAPYDKPKESLALVQRWLAKEEI